MVKTRRQVKEMKQRELRQKEDAANKNAPPKKLLLLDQKLIKQNIMSQISEMLEEVDLKKSCLTKRSVYSSSKSLFDEEFELRCLEETLEQNYKSEILKKQEELARMESLRDFTSIKIEIVERSMLRCQILWMRRMEMYLKGVDGESTEISQGKDMEQGESG